MHHSENSGPQYFISMADMLLGLLVIFLIIVFYLAIYFSDSSSKYQQSAISEEKAIQGEAEAKKRAQEAEAAHALAESVAREANIRVEKANAERDAAESAAREANIRAEEADAERDVAESVAREANIRAEEADAKFDELQNIRVSINMTRTEILKKIKAHLADANFHVNIDEETGVIRLPEAELFKTGEFVLTSQGNENIQILRKALENILPCYSPSSIFYQETSTYPCQNSLNHYVDAFFVEGHADSQPVIANALFKDNQELSTKRAIAAYDLLYSSRLLSELTNSNDEFIMGVSGYGDNRPLCSENTTNCHKKNRRIDLRLSMEIPENFAQDIGQ